MILTIYDSDVLIQEVRQAGVHGYVRKRDSDRDLISAIQALVSNKTSYPPALTPNMHRPLKRDRGKPQPGLTTRQKEIVKLLAQGFHSGKIAEMLGISNEDRGDTQTEYLFEDELPFDGGSGPVCDPQWDH